MNTAAREREKEKKRRALSGPRGFLLSSRGVRARRASEKTQRRKTPCNGLRDERERERDPKWEYAQTESVQKKKNECATRRSAGLYSAQAAMPALGDRPALQGPRTADGWRAPGGEGGAQISLSFPQQSVSLASLAAPFSPFECACFVPLRVTAWRWAGGASLCRYCCTLMMFRGTAGRRKRVCDLRLCSVLQAGRRSFISSFGVRQREGEEEEEGGWERV